MLGEDWNVCRFHIRNKKCQDAHRDVQKHNATHHRKHFSSATAPACKNNPKNSRIRPRWPSGCFHSSPLKTVFYLQCFILSTLNAHYLPATPPPKLTFLSFSHVIHHHILSLLILPHKLTLPPPSFPRYFLISLNNTDLFATLCSYHQHFSFFCHHLSLATGEGSLCGDMQIDCLWGLCFHRQTLGHM